ncbi:MAG: DUF559 domain-containing protein [Ilumatobacteraceae bacterium]
MAKAIELGWTEVDWYRAVRRGEVELLHPRVGRLIGAPRTPEQRIHAAVRAAGRTALASHRSAARLWGIPRPDRDPVDVVVDRSVTRLRLDGVVVHRPRDRIDMRPSHRGSTPCTNLLRTLVDLGATIGSVDDAVSAAITSGRVSPRALQYLLARHARPGRNGTGALRRALEAWPLDGKPADSELELRTANLLRRYGLPPATFHPPRIEGFEVDFLVDGTNVVLECVGWDYHGRTRAQFERDTERATKLMAAGYVVCPFTWRQVTRQPAKTAARIRDLLERWAPHVLVRT